MNYVLVPAEPPQICGAPSSKSKCAMLCEYPPGHELPDTTLPLGPYLHHLGRDRLGRWRSWPVEGRR